jgi:hypothetical protein
MLNIVQLDLFYILKYVIESSVDIYIYMMARIKVRPT